MSSIQRINFIEEEPFLLTYRKLALIAAGVLGIAVLFYGLQKGREVWKGREVQRLTLEVTALKATREKILKRATAVGAGQGAASLLEVFGRSIVWSALLEELTARTPRALWLSSIQSYEKAEVPSHRGLKLQGRAEEAAAITSFLKSLSASPFFQEVVLTSLKQERGPRGVLYPFDVDLVVGPAAMGRGAGGGGQ